jgi:PAS domain S-box-containing protein
LNVPIHRSLAGRIALGIVAIQIAALAVTGYYYVRAFQTRIEDDRLTRLGAPARLMQCGLLSFESVADARILRDLTGEEIDEAILFGFQGNVFHSLKPDRLGGDVYALGLAHRNSLENLPDSGLVTTTGVGLNRSTEAVFPLTPSESHSPFLFLYLRIRATELEESKAAVTRRFLWGSAATLGATSLALIGLFAQLVAKRLRVVTRVVGQLEKGELSERYVGPEYGDEISLLAKGVNAMGQRLESAFDSLQKKVEEANHYREQIQQHKDYLEALLSHLPVAVFAKEPRGDFRFLYANPRASQLFGRPADQIVGHTSEELLGPAAAERIREADQQCLETKTEIQNSVGTFRRPDGGEVSVETMRVPVLDSQGLPRLLLCIEIDITERLKAEEARQRLEAQLRQAQKMEAIGTLAGGIAHDFNNILSAIVGNAEMLLLDRQAQDASVEEVEQILQASHRAKALVQQILTFSRKQEAARQPILLQTVVKDALRMLRATLPAMVEIRSELVASARPVLGDPVRLHQLLMNLATNAAQAMEEKGGILEVRLRECSPDEVSNHGTEPTSADRWLHLSVADSGCGMSTETLERIFDPFFTTKATGKGTGLGLAVVHGIVQEQGGVITVESKPGVGSTFHVYLPTTAEVMGVAAPAAPVTSCALRGRILVVDDEPAVAQIVGRVLERAGCRVVVCNDPEVAWRTFEAAPQEFELVLTDRQMPRQDGIQLARQIHALRPDIPILLATGLQDRNSCNWEPNLITKVISKPFTANDLIRTLQAILPNTVA